MDQQLIYGFAKTDLFLDVHGNLALLLFFIFMLFVGVKSFRRNRIRVEGSNLTFFT